MALRMGHLLPGTLVPLISGACVGLTLSVMSLRAGSGPLLLCILVILPLHPHIPGTLNA